MTNVVLFHSVYGLRPAVLDAAELLRGAGHVVTTPDLYSGRVTDDVEAGREIRSEIGIPALLELARAAVADVPPGTVYAGFSLGAFIADYLVRLDPAAAGVLLLHSTGDYEAEQKLHCPWQAHVADGDPFATPQELAQWATAQPDGGETFLYTGGGHLFADPGLPDYNAASAQLMWQRVLSFLAQRA